MREMLPTIRAFAPSSGAYPIIGLQECRVTGLGADSVACLRQDFPEWRILPNEGTGFSAVICGAAEALVASIEPPEQAQGYAIRVTPAGIRIDGHDAAGLWYGLQTLRVLLDAGVTALPTGEMRDWPSIPRRGIHLDLKGYQPKFDRLLEIITLLSRFKINTVLLEIEDKYAFRAAPDVAVPEAYSYEQFRELSQVCRARHIQVIPKLQCLGHADYLLRHEAYRALREDGHPYQYCPRNQEGFRLWSAMAEELLDAFREHDFFHIGADETTNLGQCPVCREYPRADSYILRVQQCIDFIKARGKTPIIWEDILRNLHRHLDPSELERTWSLGQDAVLMYWVYGYGGSGNEFPFLPRYQEKGLTVWGASGVSGCGPSWVQNIPPLAERALNVAAWTHAAVEHKLDGVMATAWTRIASADPPAEPIDACWFTMLYAAESMWSGAERALEPFCHAAYRAFFGGELPEGLLEYLTDGKTGKLPSDELTVSRNDDRLRLLLAAARFDDHERLRKDLYDHLHMYHGRLGVCLADYRINMLRSKTEAFRQSLDSHRTAYRDALAALYEPSTVADVLLSRFGRDEVLLAEMDTLLARTTAV